ncbi:MAG: cell division protein ZapA [Thermodesulfobacteriota bacterium]
MDLSSQRIIEIDIFGTKYRFQADENVKDPKKVEQFIKNEFEKAGANISSKSVSSNDMPALILTALNISKKYAKSKTQLDNLVSESEKRLTSAEIKADKALETGSNFKKEEPFIRSKNSTNETIYKSETIIRQKPESEYLRKKDQKTIQTPSYVKNQKGETFENNPASSVLTSPKHESGLKKPDPGILISAPYHKEDIDRDFLNEQAKKLEKKLEDFSIKGEVKEIAPGPVITTYEYKPAPGIKISKIVNLENDIKLALSALSVRIVAPIPGKNVIGIEVPNKTRETVRIKDIITSDIFQKSEKGLPLCLGKDIDGNPFASDLTKMPHLLIAGATGTGKSVCLNSMITSLLFKCSPENVKFLMIDPKRIELSLYNDIPHLLTPVVTDMKKATNALNWAVKEMEQRYDLLSLKKVRNIDQYNEKADQENFEKLPYIVLIIDELADLMMVSSRDVETALARLAQMARAAGVHMIIATQRPSVDVLTGVIKANFPTRISFQVSSKTDSRTILDTNGAEALLGNGDMIFLPPGTSKLQRLHGAFISENEVTDVIDFLKKQMKPDYIDDVTRSDEDTSEISGEDEYDPLYDKAVFFVTGSGQASISSVQRHLRIGFNRAARIIEQMEKDGLVGPAQGSKPREVLAGNFENN